MIRCAPPRHWISYDPIAIVSVLPNARAAMLALSGLPFHRDRGCHSEPRAISWRRILDPAGALIIDANLEWPMQISETEFLAWAKSPPKGRQFGFLSN